MDQHSLLFQSMVYLAAAIVFVPIAKKMGLGAVLGYLIAGIIIGPSLLGFIGREGEDIMHFAEFGVVMMLFLIGIELEPALLWRLRASILGLGGAAGDIKFGSDSRYRLTDRAAAEYVACAGDDFVVIFHGHCVTNLE